MGKILKLPPSTRHNLPEPPTHLEAPERELWSSILSEYQFDGAGELALLAEVQKSIHKQHSPDGYNIGVNVGKAAGQSRMHVHVHLIPRYAGDVPDPRGGIRCVLAR